MNPIPSVLFICQSNKGKSQMAEALMNLRSKGLVRSSSTGTKAALGSPVNTESAASLARVGADMSAGTPKFASTDDLSAADRIIILGTAAQLETDDPAILTKTERWETVEPSYQGIDGAERMDLIRDDIDRRVKNLLKELTA